jgi:hypothetical protein
MTIEVPQKLLEHFLECDQCPKQGSIVNPKREEYCAEGYGLLLDYIELNKKVKHVLNTIDLMKVYKK